MSSSLKRQTISALLWDLLGTFSTQGVSFIVSIFLARLLSPEDFGLVGMALVFIGISQILSDLGFRAALIQRTDNDQIAYSSVFYLNVGIGLFLCLVFQLAATPIAQFYERPEIEPIVRYLSFGLPVSAFAFVQTTLLQKRLQLKTLSLIIVISSGISGVFGILLAFTNYGVYALVAQNLAATLSMTLLLWLWNDWRPKLIFSFAHIRSLLGFSQYVFFSQATYKIIQQLDTLLIGKLFSPTTLGFYTRADSLNQLIVRYTSHSINKVFLPVLSQLQHDLDRFKSIFLKVIEAVACFTFLLSGILLFSSEAIFIQLFGEKWRPSIYIFQILMLRVINYPINSIAINAFLALGQAKQIFWHGNVHKIIRISTYLFAFFFGFEIFLYSIVCASYLGTLYYNLVVAQLLKIKLQKLLYSIYSFVLLAAIAVFFAWWIGYGVNDLFLKTILAVGIFSIMYVLLSIFSHPNLLQNLSFFNIQAKDKTSSN